MRRTDRRGRHRLSQGSEFGPQADRAHGHGSSLSEHADLPSHDAAFGGLLGAGGVRSATVAEQAERAGVAVQEGSTLDLADLAVAEETAQRHVAQVVTKQARVLRQVRQVQLVQQEALDLLEFLEKLVLQDQQVYLELHQIQVLRDLQVESEQLV